MKCRALFDQVPDTEGDVFQTEFAGLHFRDVQYVVKQPEQAFTGVQGNFYPVALGRIQLALECQAEHPENTIERSPDLMAHAGQEIGPCPRPANCIFLGFDQGAITALQSIVLFGDLPGPVRHLLLKLGGVVFHGTLGVPELCKARIDGFQVLVDDTNHGPDLVFPMVCRDRKPDLFRRGSPHLAQCADHIEHGTGQHKIENGKESCRQDQAFQ